jgi:threonine aldolase
MLNFICDYNTGCHPAILKRLQETNMEPQSGYGNDEYCLSAAKKIATACGCPDAQVEFTVGGTQTNQIVISSMLGPLEGVISASTGHVNAHESGAIEITGHKVLSLPGYDGKLKASDVGNYLGLFYGDENHSHMVYPGMVYISYPTEYGTLYTKKELEDLKSVCTEYNIPLFIDGARLGYGLMSDSCDLTLKDIARIADVFYIGGTKVGALCGEAIVFTHGNRPERFVGLKKQRGGLLAKGRLLGIQFDVLFTGNLYFDIARNAIERANELKALLASKGYSFLLDSPTNQQFVILEDSFYKKLSKLIGIEFWEKPDETHTAVRFATSWSTTKEDILELKEVLDRM